VTPSPSNIEYGASFTVHTNIFNNTTHDFNGDYCAAIFDNNGAFVDYVQVLTGMSLQAGHYYQMVLLYFQWNTDNVFWYLFYRNFFIALPGKPLDKGIGYIGIYELSPDDGTS